MKMRQVDRFVAALAGALALAGCSSTHPPAGPSTDPALDNPGSVLGSSGAGGASVNPNRCVEGQANTTRVSPRVILVLDGSCSMSTDYPANGMQSATQCTQNPNGRWAALRNALLDPKAGVVPKLQHIVKFGLVVFGTQPRCPIPTTPIQPALDNLNMISSQMPMVQPGMFTPTGPALDYVYKNMIQASNPDGDNSPQIVILATDGEPNSCGSAVTNYQPSIDAVTMGTAMGVTTYIISLADSAGSFHDHLQQLANLGDKSANGNAKLFTPGSPDELEADLQDLVGGAVGCDIALNGTIMMGQECTGTVTLNGTPIGCNDPNGWKLLDSRHIQLQGTSCTALKDQNAMVDARFPCSVFDPG